MTFFQKRGSALIFLGSCLLASCAVVGTGNGVTQKDEIVYLKVINVLDSKGYKIPKSYSISTFTLEYAINSLKSGGISDPSIPQDPIWKFLAKPEWRFVTSFTAPPNFKRTYLQYSRGRYNEIFEGDNTERHTFSPVIYSQDSLRAAVFHGRIYASKGSDMATHENLRAYLLEKRNGIWQFIENSQIGIQ